MASYSTISEITTPEKQTATMATHNFTTPNEKTTGSTKAFDGEARG